MAGSKVEICGVDTSKLPILSQATMREMLPRIHAGDQRARDAFVQGNLRLVLSVIQRFAHRGENADDLFQVGCIGLMKAIDNFDISQNVRFSTYAVPMIIGEIRRYLRDNNPVRVARSLRDTAYKALQARERLANSLGRDPSIEELANEMQIKREDVVFALESIQTPVSLYEPVFHDGNDVLSIMDQVRDEKDTDERWMDNFALSEAIRQLGDREKRIVRKRFFEGRTQMEVAQEIGISQAQVSRLEKAALLRIRRHLT